MKGFRRLFIIVIIVIAVTYLGTNLYFAQMEQKTIRQYRVDAERIATKLESVELKDIDLKQYPSILQVIRYENQAPEDFFEGENKDYLIRIVDGLYYRMDYQQDTKEATRKMLFLLNLVLTLVFGFLLLLLLYIQVKILHPFQKITEVPYELSKGNLTMPLKENRSRYFGRFVWGLDLLREHLEQNRIEEIQLQKEKKTLILSISHDNKTPLSAIKLYAKALSKNIYDDQEKNREVAEHINAKADEIESYVSQIVKASGEDFLNLTVTNGEFYQSELIQKIHKYYSDKLALVQIEFQIQDSLDSLLKGDLDRAVEVLQNIMENAIKYGDGDWIYLTFSEEEDCRLITISNSGCTLNDSESTHIFDAFWRGSNATHQPGSGLGLYICRQLMNQMEGEVFSKCDAQVMSVTVLFRKA